MQKQVITISRKKYAAGLFWQPVPADSRAREHAAALSKSIDKKLGFFAEYKNMTGIGGRKMGHKSRMPVAAPDVIAAFSEYSSFLSCFASPQGFWLIGVRNGIIVADSLYADVASAKTEFAKLSALPDWGILVAPKDWKMPRTTERHLDDLLTGNGGVNLKPISNLKGYVLTLLLVGSFIFGAFYAFREPIIKMLAPKPQISKINPELASEFKQKLEEKKQELNNQFYPLPPPPEPLVMPYEELTDKYQAAHLCWQAIGFVMQSIPGWVQLSADCDLDIATARLRRSYGTLADLYAVVPELMRGTEITELSDSDVILRVNLPLLDTHASLEEMDADSVIREINSIFQLLDLNANVRPSTEEASDGIQTEIINVVLISTVSKLKPSEFMRIFDSVQGVSLQKVSWDGIQKIWNYEVKVYVK